MSNRENCVVIKKKPKLTYRELVKQISDRTGTTFAMTKAFMDTFDEVIKESLLGQVEVPIGTVCTLSWMQINPRENVQTWDPWKKEMTEPHDVPGFQKTTVQINNGWKRQLKELTLFYLGEENPVPTTLPDDMVVLKLDDNDDEEEETDELPINDDDE